MGGGPFDDQADLGFKHKSNNNSMISSSSIDTDPLPDKVSGIGMSSIPRFNKSTAGNDPFIGTHWDPISHMEDFGGGSSLVSHCEYCNQAYPKDDQGKISTHRVQYPLSDTCLVDIPNIQRFSSGSVADKLAERVGREKIRRMEFLCQLVPGCDKINGEAARLDGIIHYVQSLQHQVEFLTMKLVTVNHEVNIDTEWMQSIYMTEGEQQEDMPVERLDQPSEQGGKEQNQSTSLQNKQSGEHSKDFSQTKDDTEHIYINVRARRSLATDRHSLAKRIRREKISERLKFLHELVPGCKKISASGKAVILDEIINYVQSLQRQVEFLTMKLGTVNQESHIDKERIVSKDITEEEQMKDMSLGSFDQLSEQYNTEQHRSSSLKNKRHGKQAKESSQTEDGTKDNYINVRARRGEATDNQGLAEKVRKEKISERMKLLRELVPGCDKITDKEVILDEIINYVQSLQRQVELLSMALATVNPELNIGSKEMLSKDVLRSRCDNPVMLDISLGMRNNHPRQHAMLQGGMQDIPNSAALYHHMPQVRLKEYDTSEVEHLKKQLEHAIVEKAEIQAQRNHAEQISLNSKLLKEITDLREEAILIRETPKRLSESVATCKDIYKDVMLVLQSLCVDKDSPTAKLVSCTSEVVERLFSTLETHFSVDIHGSEISGENDYSGLEKLKLLGERLRQTATSLAITIGEDFKCAGWRGDGGCRKDEVTADINKRGADLISTCPLDEKLLGNDDVLILLKLNKYGVNVEYLLEVGKLHNVIKDLKHVNLDDSGNAEYTALRCAKRHLTAKLFEE